ncbi:MAG: lysophospholipid acyltransferase family protein [Motiliproteus sp.]
MMSRLCNWIAKRLGWTLVDERPEEKHYVLVGYPHTSNWDFILAMLFKFAKGLHFNWVAKHTLFAWPFGGLMRALGGIGIDRSRRQGFTAELAEEFKRRPEMAVVIAPEGTRSYTDYWRSGFYHMAREAGVPVVLSYVCYKSKRVGFGPALYLSGDQDADLAKIQAFYADKVGLHPEKAGKIGFRPK